MCNEKFAPIIRFAVMSDIHLKDEPSAESERFKKGIADAYKIARNGEIHSDQEGTRSGLYCAA